MTAQTVAELLSALAAFVTIGMACIELYARNSAKKAEVAIDMYAEYLLISQQLDYSIRNIETLVNNCKKVSINECKAFAKIHILDTSIISKIERIENVSIKSSDHSKEQGKINSMQILDFTGKSINLVHSINTFYTTIAEGDDTSAEWIMQHAKIVQNEYDMLKNPSTTTGELLHKNLKKLHNNSNAYIILLFVLSALFLSLCFFL